MRFEIRKSGGPTCSTCGSYDLLHVDHEPLNLELTQFLEVEMLRREVRLAQVFKEHLETVERDYAERMVNQSQAALLERGVLLSEFNTILAGMNIETSPWRVFKTHREKRFRERIETAVNELRELTKYPFTDPASQQRELVVAPDRS